MNNWFEVGEEVSVVSYYYPEIEGEYSINSFVSKYEAMQRSGLPMSAHKVFTSEIYCVLNGLKFKDRVASFVEYDFVPLAYLRKKHKPADESFKDMMQNIKSNVRLVEGVV